MSASAVIDETSVARQELRNSQYGAHANAEDLIRAHYAAITPELRASLKKKINDEETQKAKAAGWGEENIEVPDGGDLVDYAIRGFDARHQVVSFVWEDAGGEWHRGIQGYTDKYKAPGESAAAAAARQIALNDAKLKDAALAGQLDVEERLAEFEQKLRREQAEHFAKLQEELTKNLAELLKGAGSSSNEPAVTSGAGEGTGWPKQHDSLDALAQSKGVELPDGWDDRDKFKVADKIEYLKTKGVEPEGEG